MSTRPAPAFWQSTTGWARALAPLSWLMCILSTVRRKAYKMGLLNTQTLPIPVIVVGNIAVGGSGKTPVVAYLVKALQAAGYRPGIISRGYGGQTKGPAMVQLTHAQASQCFGDEPVLLAQLCKVPVAIGAKRPEAGQHLLANHPDVNILISDDGLQHYRLGRALELAVLDPATLGNHRLLPAGPLREPLKRLCELDLVLLHGGPYALPPGCAPHWPMQLAGQTFYALKDPTRTRQAQDFPSPVHAIAGIGRPERFFSQLEALGLNIIRHPFADHHAFNAGDLPQNPSAPIIMTAKDAVKCQAFNVPDVWIFPVDAHIDPDAFQLILNKIKAWTPNSSKS